MAVRIALLVAVLGALGALYATGVFEVVSEPERVRALLGGLGSWAPVLYVLAFALLEPFFVPGVAFIIPGSLVWPFWELFVLSWLGSIGAGVVGFGFARYLGRDYVKRHLPRRLHAYDERLAVRGLRTVIVVRLTLFLAPPAHWLLGLSQVSFSSFLLGSAIGFLPGVAALCFLIAFVGTTFGEWLGDRPPWFWAALAAAIAAAFLLRRWLRHRFG